MLQSHEHGDRTTGYRVLIVEDVALIAMMIEDMLMDLGHTVVAVATRLDTAEELAEREAVDVAVLDLNLDGVASYSVAERLTARGIPFLFITGYDERGVAPAFHHVPLLRKPFRLDVFAAALNEAVAASEWGNTER